MPTRIGLAAFLALCGLICSCVNQDYDLTKPIDTTINIQGDISIPIGSSEFIKIGDFLEIEESEEGIKCDTNGDYYLSFAPTESLSANFEFETVNIGKLEQTNDLIISIPTAGFTSSVSPAGISLFATSSSYTYTLPSDSKLAVSIDKAFNEESIVEIKKMETEATVSVRFNISTGAVQLSSGMKIVFPDYLTIAKKNASDTGISVSGNTITLESAITVKAGTASSIDLVITAIDFEKIPSGMGIVTVSGQRRFVINDNVSVSGNLVVNTSDFSTIPSDLKLAINFVMDDITVKSTTAKINTTYNVQDQSFELGELPEFLSNGGVTLDIWNPVIGIEVDNGTPFSASLQATLKAFKDKTSYASLTIGGDGGDKVLLEKGVSRIFISRQGTHPDSQQGDKDIKKTEMGDILSQVPSSLGIEDIIIKSETDSYVTFEHNRKYSCAVDYSFRADLAFGRGFRLEYTPEDITGLGSSLGLEGENSLDITELSLRFNMTNTIPVEFTLSASPIDAAGNVIAGADITVDGKIAAGTADAESVSPIVLAISANNDALKNLDGIRLTVTGSSNETVEGIALNKEQGIRLTEIKARLVGGFTTNLD
ncbi:MAG: hypothetical protein ACI395_09380 [Candidatus Cryptobacteroides sp.]